MGKLCEDCGRVHSWDMDGDEFDELVDMLLEFYDVFGHIHTCEYCGDKYVYNTINARHCSKEECQQKCDEEAGEARAAAEDARNKAEAKRQQTRAERKAAESANPPAPPENPAAPLEGWRFGRRGERSGFVYLIGSPSGAYKIGVTGDVERRFKGLQAQSPVELSLVHSFRSRDKTRIERHLHDKYGSSRAHGEWFSLGDQEVDEIKLLADFQLDDEPRKEELGT